MVLCRYHICCGTPEDKGKEVTTTLPGAIESMQGRDRDRHFKNKLKVWVRTWSDAPHAVIIRVVHVRLSRTTLDPAVHDLLSRPCRAMGSFGNASAHIVHECPWFQAAWSRAVSTGRHPFGKSRSTMPLSCCKALLERRCLLHHQTNVISVVRNFMIAIARWCILHRECTLLQI